MHHDVDAPAGIEKAALDGIFHQRRYLQTDGDVRELLRVPFGREIGAREVRGRQERRD